jgi:SAM-dependent methyltransferase
MDDLDDLWHKRGNARELILDFAKDMDVNFVVTNGEIPKSDEQFDMIMLHHVLEHLHDSPRYLLIALLEQLRDGGYLFISVPNHVNLRKRLAVLVGKTSLPAYPDYYWHPGPWRGHVREYTRGDCVALAEALGLEIVEIRAVHNMLQKVPRRFRKLYQSLSGLAPSTRDTWSMVVRKPAGWTPKRDLTEQELETFTGVKFWTPAPN